MSVTLWFCLQCSCKKCLQPCHIAGFNVLYYVLYCLFLSTCVLQSVCVHTMDFVSANKQINKYATQCNKQSIIPALQEQLTTSTSQEKIYGNVTRIIIDCDECGRYWQNSFVFFVNIKTTAKETLPSHHHLWHFEPLSGKFPWNQTNILILSWSNFFQK